MVWSALAVAVITIVGISVIRSVVAVGFDFLVLPAVIAVFLLLAAVAMIHHALRGYRSWEEDDEPYDPVPWYARGDDAPRRSGPAPVHDPQSWLG